MARKRTETEEGFSSQETQKRFESALRGARIAGHKQMRDITEKRSVARASARKKRL